MHALLLQNWWYTTLLGLRIPATTPLVSNIQTEICIVGGGATGLSAALACCKLGLQVVLVERNICGGSSTGKSAGFLTPDSELELADLDRRFGVGGARTLWEAATRGIELMVAAVDEYGIDCDLVKQDSLFLGNGQSGHRACMEEYETRNKFGYAGRFLDQSELGSIVGSGAYSAGVRYSETYGVNPLRYAQGIKTALLQRGVRVYEASEVTQICDHRVVTHLGSVTADQIIFCIDKPHPSLTRYSRNIYHAQTFLSISEPLEERDVEEIFPAEPLQCWDSDLVYSYFRLTGDRRMLVGGGSMPTTFSRFDVTSPRVITRVIARLKRKFRALDHVAFIQYWPGRIDTTRDLLPTVLPDAKAPWVHYVLGCVGLPWATFCGDFVARHVSCKRECDEHVYYRYFSIDRGFLLPLPLQRVIGKQLLFSLNNAWAKYFQRDTHEALPRIPRI